MLEQFFRRSTLLLLCLIGALAGWRMAMAAPQAAVSPQAPDTAALRIVVLEGEDGVNIIKKKTAVRPVVEVRDRNNSPVAGAAVTFLLPNFGPTGTFVQGEKVFTTTTDAAGRAAASPFQPSGAGRFNINVTARYQGQTASTTIPQTNYLTAAAASAAGAAGAGGAAGGISATTIAIIAAVAGAAAVGVAVGVTRGGNTPASAAAPPVPTATIGGVSGGPVFSGPR